MCRMLGYAGPVLHLGELLVYPGFAPYPYDEHSVTWFGRTHRVLRGGSRATAGRLCRRTFRNWYEPGFCALPSGIRLARDA